MGKRKYYFTQTSPQIQTLLDKVAALPTRAELDDMMFYKMDRDMYFTTDVTEEGSTVLCFFDGATKYIVGDEDSDTGVFVHDIINLGTGYGFDIIATQNAGWPWNPDGCDESAEGQSLDVPIDATAFNMAEVGDIMLRDFASGFTIGEQVACAHNLIDGEMICSVKWNGHVIKGWYALIFAGNGTSVYIFENNV